MHRRHRGWTVLLLALCAGHPLHAQDLRRTAVDLGATIITLADPLGGVGPVVSLGAAVDAFARPRWGAGLGARVIGLVGGAAAIPDCVPGFQCIEYRSPHLVYTVTAYGYLKGSGRPVRFSYGVGWMQANGAKGFDERGTGIAEVGIHYAPRRSGRTALQFGVSAVRGLRATGGVQTIVLPSIGWRF